MPKINFDIPHSLSTEDAKDRLQRFIDYQSSNERVSDFSHNWEADTLVYAFKTFGIKIQGRMEVGNEKLGVECELPFSAMMFKGKIESEMNQQIARLLK